MPDYVQKEPTMPVRFTDMQKKWEEQKRKTAYELKLAQGFAVADMYLTQQYLDRFSAGTVYEPDAAVMDVLKMRVYQISKLVYDPEEQINDKLISVYSSLHNMNSAVALIIRSDNKEVGFYAAVRSEDNAELAGETLCSVLKGNFPGIDLSAPLNGNEKRALLDAMTPGGEAPKSLATVSLIPSERDDDKNEFIQGLEKFIGSMNRKPYTAILLAAPVDSTTLAADSTAMRNCTPVCRPMRGFPCPLPTVRQIRSTRVSPIHFQNPSIAVSAIPTVPPSHGPTAETRDIPAASASMTTAGA